MKKSVLSGMVTIAFMMVGCSDSESYPTFNSSIDGDKRFDQLTEDEARQFAFEFDQQQYQVATDKTWDHENCMAAAWVSSETENQCKEIHQECKREGFASFTEIEEPPMSKDDVTYAGYSQLFGQCSLTVGRFEECFGFMIDLAVDLYFSGSCSNLYPEETIPLPSSNQREKFISCVDELESCDTGLNDDRLDFF